MKVTNLTFARSLLISFCLAGCTSVPKTDNSVVIQTDAKSGKTNDAQETSKPGEAKTETETDENIKIASLALEVAGDLVKSKQRKDSTTLANREKIFAYQVGLPISNLDEVFTTYRKLGDKTGVYVFKHSGSSYYLVKYEAKTEDELQNKLTAYKESLTGFNGGVSIININAFCPKRDKIMVGESITKRKETLALPCLICN